MAELGQPPRIAFAELVGLRALPVANVREGGA